MTGLVYRSYSTSLDSIHRIGRPYLHPLHHHLHPPPPPPPPSRYPAALHHLQGVVMLEDTTTHTAMTTSHTHSPLYRSERYNNKASTQSPTAATAASSCTRMGGGSGQHLPDQHVDVVNMVKEEDREHNVILDKRYNSSNTTNSSVNSTDHRSPLPGDTGGVNYTPKQEQHQSRAQLSTEATSSSSSSSSSPPHHPGRYSLPPSAGEPLELTVRVSEEGNNSNDRGRMDINLMSPVSNVSSDMEDDVTDTMSCGKSDSSGDSPNCKQRRSPGSSSSGRGPGGSSGGGGGGGGGMGGPDKKVYRCQHCKYTTDRKNNLKRHVVTMHEICPKTLECCDVLFKNKASLRDHVVSCHKNGYDCRTCGRTFCRKALLKRHITVHSGQKDYICGVCGYATSHKSNLDRHKRRHGPKYGGDAEGEQNTPPQPLPASHTQQQFTPLKSNPLDVRNLVSNHSITSSSNPLHHVHHHIRASYPSYMPPTASIHRPEPIKAEYFSPVHSQPPTAPVVPSALPVSPIHILPLPPDFPHSSPVNNYPPKRPRARHILAKRLLHTYREKGGGRLGTSLFQNQESEEEKRRRRRKNKSDIYSAHCADNEEEEKGENSEGEEETKSKGKGTMTMLTGSGGCSIIGKRMLTKRLFPTLYMCRRCAVVYENQLQLTAHVEKKHKDEDCPHMPQRPLTLQARPRAW